MIRSILIKSFLLVLLSCTSTTALARDLNLPRGSNLPVGATFLKSLLLKKQPANFSIPAAPRGGADAVAEEKKDSFLKRHPFSSAVAITTCNTVAADLLTQRVFEAGPWNPKRSLLFAAFGFLYQGCAQYAIVNIGWERLFPGTQKRAIIAKICGMNLLSDPLLFMPTFYIFKETMTSGLTLATIKAALLSYKGNCLMDWRNSWMVWFPGHAVTYGVMPAHKRIPWMAFLSFFYMCVLSITRGASS
jgi:protein Mpv17